MEYDAIEGGVVIAELASKLLAIRFESEGATMSSGDWGHPSRSISSSGILSSSMARFTTDNVFYMISIWVIDIDLGSSRRG